MPERPQRNKLPKTGSSGSRLSFRPWLIVGLGLALIVIPAGVWWLAKEKKHSGSDRTPKHGESFSLTDERSTFAQYGGSASCRECHQEAFDLWKDSNHGLAERPVSEARDRAAFDPPRHFNHGSQATEVCWTNGGAVVIAKGLSGVDEPHQVERVIGNDPLQQFLVPFPGGRFQTLEASWDPHRHEWFNVYGQEDRKPGEWGHWTGRGMNWNSMCAECHNTRLRKNYEEAADKYHTTMAEPTVGCEACHGPLRDHNEWQKLYGKSGRKDPTVQRMSRAQVVDYCGFCHARRANLTGDFKPGDNFFDHCRLSMVDESATFYPDGQIRDEDYELSAFFGSKMHAAGVFCMDCHNPHTMKTTLPGNWLCMRCHSGGYTNAPIIEPVSHSRHKVFGYSTNGTLINADLSTYNPRKTAETGGECVNCHMPQTTYMQRHVRHDHGFTIPDPLLTKELGIPNACNRCHQDKSTEWSIEAVDKWYGKKMERPSRERARWVARGRQGDRTAVGPLMSLTRGETNQYWRAVAAGLLERWSGDAAVRETLFNGLRDPGPMVRAESVRALEPLVEAGVPEALANVRARLEDTNRVVRVAAAWALRGTVDLASRAGRELLHSLDVNADQPSGQLQKGVLNLARDTSAGRPPQPETLAHFRKAVEWDSNSPPMRAQMATALSLAGDYQGAVEQLKAAVRLAPADAEMHYQLGLAWNEVGQRQETIRELQKTVELEPRHARAWYNLGLAKNAQGQSEAALECLERAEGADGEDARIPYARATILAGLGRMDEARRAARRSLELRRDYPEALQLLQALER